MFKVSKDDKLSFLQQRINYAERFISEPLYLVENVPYRKDDISKICIDNTKALNYCSSQGTTQLIQLILEREYRRYQLEAYYENIMVTHGGMHALSLIFQIVRGQGSKVLCQAPIFASIAELLKCNGYHIIYIPDNLTDDELTGFLTQHADSALIYINTPNNPTGKIYSFSYMKILVNFIENTSARLVVDLVYDDFVFVDYRNFNPFLFSSIWERVFTINSVSKNWAVPGLRIGWIVSHASNIKSLVKQLEDECVCISPITQELCSKIIERGNEEIINGVKNGRDSIKSLLFLNDKIKINNPNGGTQFYAQFPVVNIDDFADYMLAEHKLVLATSSNYVMSDKKSIRLPCGYPKEKIEQCIKVLMFGLEMYLDKTKKLSNIIEYSDI